jgi:hypothetical protein
VRIWVFWRGWGGEDGFEEWGLEKMGGRGRG